MHRVYLLPKPELDDKDFEMLMFFSERYQLNMEALTTSLIEDYSLGYHDRHSESVCPENFMESIIDHIRSYYGPYGRNDDEAILQGVIEEASILNNLRDVISPQVFYYLEAVESDIRRHGIDIKGAWEVEWTNSRYHFELRLPLPDQEIYEKDIEPYEIRDQLGVHADRYRALSETLESLSDGL